MRVVGRKVEGEIRIVRSRTVKKRAAEFADKREGAERRMGMKLEVVPVLLGEGVRFFGQLGSDQIELELTRVVEAPGVTHLRFRVVK